MTHRILIVDDDDIVVFIHKMIIGECQLPTHPLTFENGSKALEYLESNHGQFEKCLVLLDLQMPVMNGWQLLDKLEEVSYKEKLAVILVTSSIDAKDRERSANYSLVRGFISKPLAMENCDELRAALAIGPGESAA